MDQKERGNKVVLGKGEVRGYYYEKVEGKLNRKDVKAALISFFIIYFYVSKHFSILFTSHS